MNKTNQPQIAFQNNAIPQNFVANNPQIQIGPDLMNALSMLNRSQQQMIPNASNQAQMRPNIVTQGQMSPYGIPNNFQSPVSQNYNIPQHFSNPNNVHGQQQNPFLSLLNNQSFLPQQGHFASFASTNQGMIHPQNIQAKVPPFLAVQMPDPRNFSAQNVYIPVDRSEEKKEKIKKALGAKEERTEEKKYVLKKLVECTEEQAKVVESRRKALEEKKKSRQIEMHELSSKEKIKSLPSAQDVQKKREKFKKYQQSVFKMARKHSNANFVAPISLSDNPILPVLPSMK